MGMFKLFSISFFLVGAMVMFMLNVFSGGVLYFNSVLGLSTSLFMFDSISFYFMVLVMFLGVYSQFSFMSDLSSKTRVLLYMSLGFSLFSFFTNHSILFWCFYELSMLPLLYLIFKESPYSERFLAGWYFSCYLLITSLPLILILLYLSLMKNNFLFSEWCGVESEKWMLVVLAFVFFTKVPLVPFHTWLPMVHAEATSMVSMFLSGYMMKLGLLGVYRCCYSIFDKSFMAYLLMALTVSVMFLITSCSELDGKRWLAFLSLAHMVIPFFAFFLSDWCLLNYLFFYCLGHGLSAGLVFGLLWFFYDLANSRNWILLKSSMGGKAMMFFVIFSMLSLCSFPPTMQFFCEVGLISLCSSNMLFVMFWCLYLFFGGLVPLVLGGHLLIRSEFFEKLDVGKAKYFNFFFFLCLWCYFGLFLV